MHPHLFRLFISPESYVPAENRDESKDDNEPCEDKLGGYDRILVRKCLFVGNAVMVWHPAKFFNAWLVVRCGKKAESPLFGHE